MWWESAIVFVAVVASAAYLALRARRALSGRGSCASACGGCGPAAAEDRPLATPLDFRAGFPPARRS